MDVKIEGLDALAKGLSERTNLDQVKKVVKLNGAELMQKMVENAEFSKGFQTGTTKRSITLAVRDGGLTAAVKPTTNYSPYLEYGTRFMEAQPFVGPAFRSQVPIFERDMKKLTE